MKYPLILILSLVLFPWKEILSQEMPPIVTDRPTQSEAASVVPLRTLQAEAGLQYTSDETDSIKVSDLTAPGLLLRYGLLEFIELRLGISYLLTRNEYKELGYDEQFDGFSPLSAGFKIFISDQKRFLPQLAFSGTLIFPGTASNPYEIKHLAARMRLAGNWELTPVVNLGANLGVEWDGFVPEATGFYSVVAGFSIHKGLGGFAEFYGYLPERSRPLHLFDAGLTYLLTNNLQLDLSGGAGLNEMAPDYFISAGASLRLPR